MDDANRSQVDVMVNFGLRRKPYYNMCRTTSRQEFIEHMRIWLGNDLPQNYTVLFYDRKLPKMIELDDNQIFYLAPIFDSISLQEQPTGVQPLTSNDCPYIELFISAKDSAVSPLMSPGTLEEFQLSMDNIIAKNIDLMVVDDAVPSYGSSGQIDTEPLPKDLFDEYFSNSNCDTQEENESSIAARHISPTTNIEYQLTDHLRMVLDVCSTPPRRNYVSNMGTKGKSNLSYLSGVRGPNDRGKQIRPIIWISDIILKWLRENGSADLIIACVRETLENDMRVWWIDEHSEFRTKGCTRKTPGVNPLKLPLTLEAIKNRKYKLNVIFNHKPGQINQRREGKLFYSLDELTLRELHPAEHDSQSSRLILLPSFHGIRQWNAVGFTNFIQEPKRRKSTASTQVEPQISSTVTSDTVLSIQRVHAIS